MDSNKRKVSVSLIVLSFITLASSAVSPTLASVELAYPEIPSTMISLLTTLPSLLAIPMTLICGQVAGKKISYRVLVIIGLACNLISGVAPFFTENFHLLLVWRGLFGCGTGILTPLIMPMMLSAFEGEDIHRQASRNAISTNIGAVLFQMLGGAACAWWNWRYTFLMYIIILPILFVVIRIMPEPKIMSEEEKRQKVRFSVFRPIWKWCALYFFHMILFYVSVTETSTVIMESRMGSSVTSAVILSIVTLSGVAGGWIYRYINRLKIKALGLAYIFLAAGYLVMFLTYHVILMGIGAMLVGIGFGINMPALQVYVGMDVPAYARSNGASLLNVFGSLGGFFSKFAVSALGGVLGFENGRNSFTICVAGYLLLMLFCFLYSRVDERKRQSAV